MSAPLYFDYHTQARPFSSALKAYSEAHKKGFAHVLAPHKEGQKGIAQINIELDTIYEKIGADRAIHFELTSGGAEAIAQVLYNAQCARPKEKLIVVTTACEEAPLPLTLDRLGRRIDVPLTSEGQVSVDALESVLNDEVNLVSLSWANGLTGVIHPIEEIAHLCQEKGIPLHVDATHVLGKLYFRLEDLPIGYLTFDAGRLGAPKGIGGLFVKESAPFKPLILGREPASLPVITALSQTFREIFAHFDTINLETARLRDHFEKAFPQENCLFQEVTRLPNTSVITFPGVASEALLFVLNADNLYASMGGGIFPRLSHVLKCYGCSNEVMHTALSFTFSFETTQEEIERGIAIITRSVSALQKRSAALMGDVK